jgi:hypothetical protein
MELSRYLLLVAQAGLPELADDGEGGRISRILYKDMPLGLSSTDRILAEMERDGMRSVQAGTSGYRVIFTKFQFLIQVMIVTSMYTGNKQNHGLAAMQVRVSRAGTTGNKKGSRVKPA